MHQQPPSACEASKFRYPKNIVNIGIYWLDLPNFPCVSKVHVCTTILMLIQKLPNIFRVEHLKAKVISDSTLILYCLKLAVCSGCWFLLCWIEQMYWAFHGKAQGYQLRLSYLMDQTKLIEHVLAQKLDWTMPKSKLIRKIIGCICCFFSILWKIKQR